MADQTIRSYRDLIVWQKAMDLAEAVYKLSAAFPRSEQFGLTAQIRRAATSVPANIAEGYARSGARDYAHFLTISRGSLLEVETFVLLAVRLGYLHEDSVQSALNLSEEVSKMLRVLRERVIA
ncbi:MAG TPA: four helix bundle protein [Chloroflexota bacterium]|nr:four helix bundle protein [Chloroflexota bacterium]